MHFAHPYMLLWLAIVPGLWFAFAWGDRRRHLAQAKFGSSVPVRRRWKRLCVIVAAISLILGLSKPVRKGEPSREETGDVVFLLDVSRSMLSADAAPSRLERAKSIITNIARQARGERTALVAFAGVASVLSPLTVDDAFFQAMLDGALPESVPRGGTRLGDAIQFTLDSVFDDVTRARKQLVLVTDGGDQDSFPTIAAKAVSTRGIRLLIIGVGDTRNGALVPTSAIDATPALYHGDKILTKLEEDVLESVAKAGSGIYVSANSPQLNAISLEFIHSGSARSQDGQSKVAPWLILLAIALLTIEIFLSDRKVQTAALAMIVIANLSAQTTLQWIEDGNILAKESRWLDAITSYQKATAKMPAVPQAYFNLGVAYYRLHRFAAAQEAFKEAAKAAHKTPLEAMSKLGAANCEYREIDDAPVEATVSLLRAVLKSYEELPELADAKFNADVVRRRLAELQKAQSQVAPQPRTPSSKPKVDGAQNIVNQGGVPGRAKPQSVDRDW